MAAKRHAAPSRSVCSAHAVHDPMNVLILGTPEHEGRMCGRAFELLGVAPSYLLDGLPHELETRPRPRPDVVLVSREWSRGVRVAVARARRKGIPVVYLMDGVIEWSYIWNNQSFVRPEGTVLQPLLADHLCVVGRHQARILASLGLGGRTHLVGLPRLDDVDRRRIVDPDSPRSVVITTARTPAHNVEQKVMVRRALRDLHQWFAAHPAVQPVWRIAPELAIEIGVETSPDVSLVEVLQTAAGLISFPSTTVLEGMLMGVPTAQIDYRAVPQYVESGWQIRAADHIHGVIQELLHPRPERLAYQAACLNDELERGAASERLAAVIRQVVHEGSTDRAVVSETDEGRFALDYRQVHSELSAFAVSPMSVLQYELDATSSLLDLATPDLVRLRSELAQIQEEAVGLRERLAAAERERDQRERALAEAGAASLAMQRDHDDYKRRVYLERLKPMLAEMKRDRVRRVTVYGAGDVGRALVDACRSARIRVDRIVDRNPALWGRTIESVPVMPLEACASDTRPVIAVGSLAFVDEIRSTVHTTLGHRSKIRIFSPEPWRL